MTLVLASRSPQRRAILTQLGLEFRVVEPSYDELPLPARAARAGRAAQPRQGALGRGRRGGDGARRRHARRGRRPGARQARGRGRGGAGCWRSLAGRTHRRRVRPDAARRRPASAPAHARTAVRFRPLDAAAIDEYVARGEWRGRAGGVCDPGGGSGTRVEHRRMLLQRRRACRSRCSSRCWASAVAPFPGEE